MKPTPPDYPDREVRSGAPRIHLIGTDSQDPSLLGIVGEAARRAGRYIEAQKLYARTALLAKQNNSHEAMCWGLWGQASSLRNRGDYEGSTGLYGQALAAATAYKVRLCERWCLAGLAEIDRMSGHLPEALNAHQHLRDVFAQDNDDRGLGWALSGLAQIYLNLGQERTALLHFEHSEEMALRARDQVTEAYALRGQAEVALRQNHLDAARDLAERALDLFQAMKYHVGQGYAFRTLSHLAFAQRDDTEAIGHCRSGLEIFVRLAKPRGAAYMLQTLNHICPSVRTMEVASLTTQARDILGGRAIWLAPLPACLPVPH